MNIVHIPDSTRILHAPKDWDSNLYGTCKTLPIIDHEGIMYSYWKVTWKERIAILLGKRIRLCVVGTTHPPVALDTNK